MTFSSLNPIRTSHRIASVFLLFSVMSSTAHALPRVAATVGLEFPHLLAGELDFIYNPRWTLGVNLGGFAYTFNTTQGPIPFSMAAGTIKVRWAPFQGTFFLALGGGLQKLGASGSRTFTVTDSTSGQSVNIPASASLDINSPYIAPHLGWFVASRVGFTFGFEAGLQIPFKSSSDIELEITDAAQSQYLQLIQATQEYQAVRTEIQDAIGKFANIVLPYAAIRIGWTF
jgi:hypothetical protein